MHLLECFPAAPATQSPPHLWMPPRRLLHTSLSHRTSLPNFRSRSFLSDASTRNIPRGPWLHLPRTTFSAPRVHHPSLRYSKTRLCRRLRTASHLRCLHTQLPLTEFFIGCIFSNDRLDRQASPSAHCAGSASPPPSAGNCHALQPFQRRSRRHYGPTCVTTAAPRSREVCPLVRPTWYSS